MPNYNQDVPNSAMVETPLETKQGYSGSCEFEIRSAFDEFLQSFEAFKNTNDERLSQLESRGQEDVITRDKLDRINTTLDEQKSQLRKLSTKSSRPSLNGDQDIASSYSKTGHYGFDQFMRKGVTTGLEAKSLNTSVDAEGGYLTPDETEAQIMSHLSRLSPIRQIASIRQVSGSVYKKPFSVDGFSSGWVSETAARAQTATGNLSELTFPTMELYAMPAATQSLLDDAAVNMDAWIADEVQTAFAEQESAAFVNGDGITQPAGFMTNSFVDEASWSWGNLGDIKTGTSGGFDDTAPADNLIDVIYALKSGYRQNAQWVMNRRTQAEVRKLKDADGNYIWQPSAQVGGAASLFNFAITESEDMPDIGADTTPIVFGDFKRGYLIVDRVGVRILRDPYSSKPYVLFYTTKRVGGGVQDYDAIKGLTFSA